MKGLTSIKIETLLPLPLNLLQNELAQIAYLLEEMQKKINKTLAKILKFLDPRKSIALYVMTFFLSIPLIVYALVGYPSFERGRAKENMPPYPPININSPKDGSHFKVGDIVDIEITGIWRRDDRITVYIKGILQKDCTWVVVDPVQPPNTTCEWTITSQYVSSDPVEIKAVLSRGNDIEIDTIHVYVEGKGWTVTIVDPKNETVSRTVDIIWNVFGIQWYETNATKYTISLEEKASPNEISSPTIIAQGKFNDVCYPMLGGGYYQCKYQNWDTTKHPNGDYYLIVDVSYVAIICPEPPCFYGDQDKTEITIDNRTQNQKPVCTSLQVQPTEIASGGTVNITATGNDPDGENIVKGKINFGDGQTSGELNASNNTVTTSHTYTTQRSTTFTITAQFFDGKEWGDFGCPTNVTVTVSTQNNCPSITSNPITTVKTGQTYSYTLSATDPDGDQLLKGASVKPAWLSFDSITGTLSGKPTNSDVGDHVVILYVNDQHGCTVTQSFVITVEKGDVRGGETERHRPTVNITYPNQGAKLACHQSTITWTASDQDGTVQKAKIEYSPDASNWSLIVDNLQGSTTSYDWDVCTIDPGNYYIKVTVTDNDGLTGADISDQFEIIEFGVLDSAPKISDLKPADGSIITETQPEISAKFTAYGSEIDVNSIEIKVDGENVTPFAKKEKTGVVYKPTSDLELGEHTVSVKVADEKDRTSQANWKFTISTKEEKKRAGTINIFGKEIPAWLALSGLICLILGLLILIIAAIIKLIKLGREASEVPPTETSWTPPETSASSGPYGTTQTTGMNSVYGPSPTLQKDGQGGEDVIRPSPPNI